VTAVSKFADELFTDLMRQYRTTLEQVDRTVLVVQTLAGSGAGPGRRRPPWRRASRLAPVAAALGVLLAVGLAAGLGGLSSGPSQPIVPPIVATSQTVFAFNAVNGTLTPISPVTHRAGRPIKVGPGLEPFEVASFGGRGPRTQTMDQPAIQQNVISPDGKTDYVVYRGPDDALLLREVSLVTGAMSRPVNLGSTARSVTFTPNGQTAYVTYWTSPLDRNSKDIVRAIEHVHADVRPVSLATGAVGRPVAQGTGTPRILITPNGVTAYMAFAETGTVIPVTTATNTPGPAISVPGAGYMQITSGGRTLDVMSGDTVTPISTATNTPGQPIHVKPAGGSIDITPDGNEAYVIPWSAYYMTPFSFATGRAGKRMDLKGAGNVVYTPDSKTAYFANVIYSRVTPVATTTNTIGRPINVPGFPLYLAMTPDGKTLYAYNSTTIYPISTATGRVGPGVTIRHTKSYIISVLVPGQAQNSG
jgi:hypothetical protein